jgi:hypothetical protein
MRKVADLNEADIKAIVNRVRDTLNSKFEAGRVYKWLYGDITITEEFVTQTWLEIRKAIEADDAS